MSKVDLDNLFDLEVEVEGNGIEETGYCCDDCEQAYERKNNE
jgi:hypothetical protein